MQHTFNAPIQTAPPSTQVLRGHVADRFEHRALRVQWNGSRLEGRIGGWWFPQTFALERSGDGLIGRSGNLAFNFTRRNGVLEGLVGGAGFAERITLGLHTGLESHSATEVHSAQGSLERNDAQEPIQFFTDNGALTLSLGTHTVQLGLADAPDWVGLSAALVAVITQRELSRTLLESLSDLRDS